MIWWNSIDPVSECNTQVGPGKETVESLALPLWAPSELVRPSYQEPSRIHRSLPSRDPCMPTTPVFARHRNHLTARRAFRLSSDSRSGEMSYAPRSFRRAAWLVINSELLQTRNRSGCRRPGPGRCCRTGQPFAGGRLRGMPAA